ncbi:MAG TPA: TFIIB-type zinc ribbon-containing protein [Candidatus Nanoarchaeia archaeon]|nr:TFIIB-type zinc ribbon-containing protein [Candidatus Nanoarchaeia archaeon]
MDQKELLLKTERVPSKVKAIGKCPECDSMKLHHNTDHGEIICRDCGLVLEDKIMDHGKDWREMDDAMREQRRRTGAPLTYTQADRGLGTEIGTKSDLYKLAGRDKDKFFRLRKWQRNTATAIERNLQLALTEIHRISSVLQLSKILNEECSRVYTTAAQRGLVRGRSTEHMVAAVIYIACRNYGAPKTLDEISHASGVNKKEIGRNYRYLIRNLNLKVAPSDPTMYVGRYISELKLSPKTQTKAVELIEKAQAKEITSGKSPIGIVAAAIYAASKLTKEKTTQEAIADAIGITEVTIRNRYKELVENLGLKSLATA